ncbi:MAG: hypothetical protein LBK65_10780 [Tannerellaceae bacterium]|jgi:hypothetical protein|nr:hypothetical protein [Tannerellaceae bacterium]
MTDEKTSGDLRAFLRYYSGVMPKSGLEKITGVNQKQLWHYCAGKRTPRRETLLKIQERIVCFADELKAAAMRLS